MPDSISAFEVDGQTFFATANEGDAREWGDYTDEVELKDLVKEGKVCDDLELADGIEDKKFAGNLKLSNASGWDEQKGCFDGLYSYGSRSFSIYNREGNVVFDSGSDFEEITKGIPSLNFNADNEDPEFDDRSDNKGPEPEALTIGKVGDRTYAFIGAERVGGIFVYDVTTPTETKFVTYVNSRDFSVGYNEDDVAAIALAGDLGPEGLAFVPATDSPTDDALLIAGNEVSGTTTVFSVKDLLADAANSTPDKPNGSSTGSSIAAGAGIIDGLVGLGALIGGALNFLPKPIDEFYALLPAQVRKLLPQTFRGLPAKLFEANTSHSK